MNEYGLGRYDAGLLTTNRATADYYEAVLAAGGGDPKVAANWVTGELSGALNRDGLHISQSPVDARMLGRLLARIEDGSYGTCEHCEDEIPQPRIQALPFARLCVGCQEATEKPWQAARGGGRLQRTRVR